MAAIKGLLDLPYTAAQTLWNELSLQDLAAVAQVSKKGDEFAMRKDDDAAWAAHCKQNGIAFERDAQTGAVQPPRPHWFDGKDLPKAVQHKSVFEYRKAVHLANRKILGEWRRMPLTEGGKNHAGWHVTRPLPMYGARITRETYYKYAETFPNAPMVPQNADGIGWYNAARAYFDLGRYDDALTACDEALAQRPVDGPVMLLKARLMLALGRTQEAQQYALKIPNAAEFEPSPAGRAQRTQVMALAYHIAAEARLAAQAALPAARRQYGSAMALVNKAMDFVGDERAFYLTRARIQIADAEAIDASTSADERSAAVRLKIKSLLQSAVEDARQAISKTPEAIVPVGAYMALGAAQARLGDFAEAATMFKVALAAAPNYADAHAALSTVYARLGDGKGAQKEAVIAAHLRKTPGPSAPKYVGRTLRSLEIEVPKGPSLADKVSALLDAVPKTAPTCTIS